MIRRPPRSTRVRSSAASDVYKRQVLIRTIEDESDIFAIPYRTERGGIEYVNTDAIATIIDFGFSYIKVGTSTWSAKGGRQASLATRERSSLGRSHRTPDIRKANDVGGDGEGKSYGRYGLEPWGVNAENKNPLHDAYKLLLSTMATMYNSCLLYTSPSPRDRTRSRM